MPGFSGTPIPAIPDPSEPVVAALDGRGLGHGPATVHVFGRYRLFAKLGSGGQADVYLAVASGTLGIDKLVVIKRARFGLAAETAQTGSFLDEARFTLRLNHPNLVHTYEVGEEQGTHFFSMEHIEGLSLKELFASPRTRDFGEAIWLRIVADALGGLAHAHALRDYDGKPLGIVHRDISPHNVVVRFDGVTKVLDFGIAKAAHGGTVTEIGALTGKISYMAPEQVLGSADRRSDLFAMGVVLWEMLSGRRLFDGDPSTIMSRLIDLPIPRLGSVMPDVDADLEEIVARALAKNPADRYQSANEMRQTLERYLRKTGNLVRELEVGEAISAAFHQERRALQERIQVAMAAVTAEISDAGDEAARRVPGSALAAMSTSRDPAAIAAASRSRSRRRRPGWRTAAAVAGIVVVASLLVIVVMARPGGSGRAATGAALQVTNAPDIKLAGAPGAACARPLRVRIMFDMSGATREVGTAAGKGAVDYLRALNDAGGIRGCKIELDVQDTKYDKHTALEIYNEWKARSDWPEVSTIFVQGTPMTQALGPLAAEDHKIILSGAYAGELAAPTATVSDVAVPSLNRNFAAASVRVRKQSPGYSHVFFQGTDYTTAARVAATYAWRQGAKRMAFFYCSTSAFCTDPVDGAKTFLKALGGTEIGRDLFIELGDDEFAIDDKVAQFFAQERRYKAAHPSYQMVDWVWFGNTTASSAFLGKALAKSRHRFRMSIDVIGNNWSVDESLHRRCGTACVGFNSVQPFAMFGDLTAAGTAALLADHARYRALDGDPIDAYRTVQYVYGRVAVATWKLAVERVVDQRQLVTGASLQAAFESFRHVDIEGFATIGYSRSDHRPQSGARVVQLNGDGQLHMIGPPLSLSLQEDWLGW